MLTGQKIPFINENLKMKDALKIINKKKLGVLIAQNSRGYTTGILTDGTIRRASLKNKNLQSLTIKKIMTKKGMMHDVELPPDYSKIAVPDNVVNCNSKIIYSPSCHQHN